MTFSVQKATSRGAFDLSCGMQCIARRTAAQYVGTGLIYVSGCDCWWICTYSSANDEGEGSRKVKLRPV